MVYLNKIRSANVYSQKKMVLYGDTIPISGRISEDVADTEINE